MSESGFRPPLFAEKLLNWMSLYEEDFLCKGDMNEEFKEKARTEGFPKARRWYVFQVVKSYPPYLYYSFFWSLVMIKNYLITALRNTKRQKFYSFLNLSGLAVGITCFILISLYIQHELNFDRFHENADRIYRVCFRHAFVYQGKNESAITPAPLAPALKEDLPSVVSSVRLVDSSEVLLSTNERSIIAEKVFFSSPGLFDVFTFPLLRGFPEQALLDPYSIVISEREATKLFGSADPLGKTLSYEGQYDLTVTGVLQNPPDHSHLIADYILPFSFYGIVNDLTFTSWTNSGYYTYIKLKDGTDPSLIEENLLGYMKRSSPSGKVPEGFAYFLQPLTRIHLHSDLIAEISPNGDINSIYLFGFIAFLILIIACINSINLVTARAAQRGKEVGLRKVIGARRGQVIKQFIGESYLLSAMAVVLSYFLVQLLLPSFNVFVGRDLDFRLISNPKLILEMTALLISIGFFTGMYPALVLSSIKPVSVLKGVLTRKTKGISLRNGLVVLQFAISITLVICTLAVRGQLLFLKNTDVGYRKDHIITVRIRDPQIRKNLKVIKDQLLSNSNILAVSTSSSLPHLTTSLHRARHPQASVDEYFPMYQNTVDYDFLNLYEIEMVAGRSFSREFQSDGEGTFILNEAAVKALGYEDPINKEFVYPVHGGAPKRGRIIGVMSDFNMLALYQGIEPLNLALDPSESQRYLSVKIRESNIQETIASIKKTLESISTVYPFEYQFFDDVFLSTYLNEKKLGQMFNAFGLLAIFIACLGLFGLASFTIQQKTKEIGIRKVLGASSGKIFTWLSKDFTKWVFLANGIAWPIAYLLMNKWLQNFSYRISLGLGLFVVSAAAALLLALITIVFQAAKAANSNPVEALKTE
jgi:putative ABC transport system permease protein